MMRTTRWIPPLLGCLLLCFGPGCGGDDSGGDPPISCEQEDGWVVWEQCCNEWGELEEGGNGCSVANDEETVAGFCTCFVAHGCTLPPGCEDYSDTDTDTDSDTDTE